MATMSAVLKTALAIPTEAAASKQVGQSRSAVHEGIAHTSSIDKTNLAVPSSHART